MPIHWRVAAWMAVGVVPAFLIFGFRSATAIFALLILAGAGFAALRVRGHVREPLEELTRRARGARPGDTLPSRIRGAPEIEALTKALGEWSEDVAAELGETAAARNHLESILEAMAEGVLVFDADARIVLGNPAAERLLDSPRGVEGKTCLEVFRDEALDRALRDAIEGRPVETVEFRTGAGRVVQASLAPIAGDAENGVETVVAVLHDLTDIRQAERIRSDFVANVSHEFKTPLTSIRGYAETIAAETPGDSHKEFARIIERNARDLESLVNDMLDLARLEAEPPSALDTFDLSTVIHEQVSRYRSVPEAAAIEIEVDCPSIRIRADRERLGTALANLIDNAVRYNRPDGDVRVQASASESMVAIAVADSGYGIPHEGRSRIFERFFRLDRARTRQGGGTGLGLAIARHAVESQGGTLTVDSTIGSGSTFTIRLPA